MNKVTDNQEPQDDLQDAALRNVSTRALGDTDTEENEPRWGSARFGDRTNLVLKVRGAKEAFVYDANSIEELVLGRRDPDSNEIPDIDLEPYDAQDKGVSRRHIVIVKRDGALNIVDLGSHNGSYLNGQRLVPNQPRILRDGDDLRLGHLVLHVSFIRG